MASALQCQWLSIAVTNFSICNTSNWIIASALQCQWLSIAVTNFSLCNTSNWRDQYNHLLHKHCFAIKWQHFINTVQPDPDSDPLIVSPIRIFDEKYWRNISALPSKVFVSIRSGSPWMWGGDYITKWSGSTTLTTTSYVLLFSYNVYMYHQIGIKKNILWL